jgi:hypothetical protein
MEMGGEQLTVLTTDLHLARQHLSQLGATAVGPVDLAEAVRRLGIAAALTHLG